MRPRNMTWTVSIPLNRNLPGFWILTEIRVSVPGGFLCTASTTTKAKADRSNCQGHHPSSLPKFRRSNSNTARWVVALNIHDNPNAGSSDGFCGAQNPTEKYSTQRSGGRRMQLGSLYCRILELRTASRLLFP